MPSIVHAYNLKAGTSSQSCPGTRNCIWAQGFSFKVREYQLVGTLAFLRNVRPVYNPCLVIYVILGTQGPLFGDDC